MGSFGCCGSSRVVSDEGLLCDFYHPLVEKLTGLQTGAGQDFGLSGRRLCSGGSSHGRFDRRIILIHMLPNALSHIIVVATLSIPGMILSETSLSFLGLGIQPPTTSWGVLLQQSQQVSVVLQRPWLLLPGLFVVLAVLAFNFLGDGIRDAVDPYSS